MNSEPRLFHRWTSRHCFFRRLSLISTAQKGERNCLVDLPRCCRQQPLLPVNPRLRDYPRYALLGKKRALLRKRRTGLCVGLQTYEECRHGSPTPPHRSFFESSSQNGNPRPTLAPRTRYMRMKVFGEQRNGFETVLERSSDTDARKEGRWRRLGWGLLDKTTTILNMDTLAIFAPVKTLMHAFKGNRWASLRRARKKLLFRRRHGCPIFLFLS